MLQVEQDFHKESYKQMMEKKEKLKEQFLKQIREQNDKKDNEKFKRKEVCRTHFGPEETLDSQINIKKKK